MEIKWVNVLRYYYKNLQWKYWVLLQKEWIMEYKKKNKQTKKENQTLKYGELIVARREAGGGMGKLDKRD